MRQFIKVLICVVILGAVCFGVYTVLPSYPQSFVKSLVQPIVNEQAKTRINAVKSLYNSDVDATYEQILELHTANPFWVYEIDEATGTETITFYGTKAYINIKDLKDHNDMLYTSCQVKFTFTITGNTVNITAYIDGVAQDDVVKELMIQQLKNGNG